MESDDKQNFEMPPFCYRGARSQHAVRIARRNARALARSLDKTNDRKIPNMPRAESTCVAKLRIQTDACGTLLRWVLTLMLPVANFANTK